ncbi:hypothetical protein MAPG_04234 [Magnaporthiopsis poae ATCC 64411]|uniref:Trichothecene 3-O-acetyltransferase n=1 Tax=Magnaporthiopsis poae (strain ATCC 64411 / 73-15) TaxID=644358 RepID=A0A0C4DW60_MAGP6|nr:hypothetical protein MAPG_04234 [Magnaporthiopsis poae ATCC 64411]
MGAAHTSMVGSDPGIPLDLWSQTAPRDWVAYGMCFPHSGGRRDREKATQALQAALNRLARERPRYAGRLRLSRNPETPGRLLWTASTSIDFRSRDISDEVDVSYDQLRNRGFPASFFHNPNIFVLGINPNPADATQPGGSTPLAVAKGGAAAAAASTTEVRVEVPVVAIRCFFIKGGLILQACLHHAFGDGCCMHDFLHDLALVTRGQPVLPRLDRRRLHLPPDFLRSDCPETGAAAAAARHESREAKAERLVDLCPEYKFDPQWFTGPTQPHRSRDAPAPPQERVECVVVTITTAKLAALRRCLRSAHGSEPSDYIALSTLTWAYVTLHRSEQEGCGGSREEKMIATLSNPVNWKRKLPRVPYVDLLKDYFGNATAKCLTHFELGGLADAARACAPVPRATTTEASRGDDDASLEADPRLNINAVDKSYVGVRMDLYRALPDPRNLGLVDDPYSVAHMQFNTWKAFGSDAMANGGARAESVRKVMMGKQPDYRNVLIMPTVRPQGETEILISLPARSLAALLKDEGFTRWFCSVC